MAISKVTLTFDDGTVTDFLSLNDALEVHGAPAGVPVVEAAPVAAPIEDAVPVAAPAEEVPTEVPAEVPAEDAPAA